MVNTNIKIIRDEKEDIESQIVIDKWIFYILISIVLFVPLIVLGHVTDVVSPLIDNRIQLQSGSKVDIFTHYKNILLVVLTSSALLLFLYKLYFLNYQLPRRHILWFFVIFIIGILLSTLLSESIKISLFGQYNRSDGAISYLCYILLMFIAMNIQYPAKTIKYVLYSFYPLVIINFILSIMNFFGNDALKYNFVEKIISIRFTDGVEISEGSMLLGTLNHWNYMSGMFSVITILYLTSVLLDSSFMSKTINFIFALISGTIMLVSMSASGFVTFICILPFIIWVAYKSIRKIKAIAMVGLFIILLVPIIHILSSENPKVWEESIGFLLPINPYSENTATNLNLDQKNTWELSGEIGNKAFAEEYQFSLPELPEGKWGAGTGRIYIWQTTLGLLSNRPLFGYGLDTLMYNFPHDHIEARANLNEVTIVDKPHSLYIGVLYGTGIIGFIGFFGVILFIAWNALLKIMKYKHQMDSILVIISVAWLAFLTQALFNDSLPGTTPPLFILAGILMAHIYKEKELNLSNNEGNKHD